MHQERLLVPAGAGTATATAATAEADAADAADAAEAEARLRSVLADPAFRARPGFPIGSDAAILAMSDPPRATACPNPFLAAFVAAHGQPDDPAAPYHREPFAVDVSVGKTDPLYKAHSYHTKVPHKAIVPSILHYTDPGDLVLDGFCGSGMTGVAAQWCGIAPAAERAEIAARFAAEGRPAPRWGGRRAILNDLSPAATFIAANYVLPFDVEAFAAAARALLAETEREVGWMYETRHRDGRPGRIDYTVWSQVFACPECGAEITFSEEALDAETKRVAAAFPCPRCAATLTKERLERVFDTSPDPATGVAMQRPRRRPVLIQYRVGGDKFEKKPDDADLAIVERIASLPIPAEIPVTPLPYMHMTHERARMDRAGVTHVHHFFLPRAAQALAVLWRRARAEPEPRTRRMLLFTVEQAIWTFSIMNRFRPTGFSQVSQYMTGVYYVPSQHAECSPAYILGGKVQRLPTALRLLSTADVEGAVSTGTCADLPLPADCVDYVFTDPPFGENIYYADLNFLVEAFHGVATDAAPEAIVDRAKRKGLPEYQELMRACFGEYFRVLKPGRWLTVVFSNARNSVWNAIQEAMLAAGFVVADVRTLDKQQGSFRQVTSTAVKQDLVISAYKPAGAFERAFGLEAGTEEGAWAFVRAHLGNLPGVAARDGRLEPVSQRRADVLYDRMVAFHVQRGVAVPLSAAGFRAGLPRRFVERDGMYFLPDQAPAYDAARLEARLVGQLPLFVSDEKSAIGWLRQLLDEALGGQPRTYQEILPLFLRELSQARHERLPELREILAQNFLEDAAGVWRLPDPTKAEDLERVRRQALLREFADYLERKGRLREFRTEAVRAGFADAYRRGAFAEIIRVAERLPEEVLQEDPDLLMYYDHASLRA